MQVTKYIQIIVSQKVDRHENNGNVPGRMFRIFS